CILDPQDCLVGRVGFYVLPCIIEDACRPAFPCYTDRINPFHFVSNYLVLPRLFHIGNFNLPSYGLLVALGVLIGLWISLRNSEKHGINADDAWNFGILVVLCGIIGAKILYIINDWGYYTSHPGEIFSLGTLQAGGVFSGGLIAALAAAAWYIRKHNMPALG